MWFCELKYKVSGVWAPRGNGISRPGGETMKAKPAATLNKRLHWPPRAL